MKDITINDLPQIHFGKIEEPVDWREEPEEEDVDDELLPKSDPFLVYLLGFDPIELSK